MEKSQQETKKRSKVPHRRRQLPVTYVPKLWEQADLRMASVRTIRSRYKEFVSDSNAVSVMKKSLCDRAAFLSVFIETLEVIAVETGELESGPYVQAVNAYLGLLKTLGLDKATTEITLKEYQSAN